ncbi:MAG: metallophosphoesterase [Kosmotogaceae bacterium]|nr:metallophosphoesterase [Kosmotogaceae bacterium]
MSDSHDNMPRISESVEIAVNRGVEVLIHCGDLVSPFSAKALTKFKSELHVVIGNNDGEVVGLKNILGNSLIKGPAEIEIHGRSVVVMHEPFGLSGVINTDFLFYGHTHHLDIRLDSRPVIINPGECCGYLTGKSTVLVIDPDNLEYELIQLR